MWRWMHVARLQDKFMVISPAKRSLDDGLRRLRSEATVGSGGTAADTFVRWQQGEHLLLGGCYRLVSSLTDIADAL